MPLSRDKSRALFARAQQVLPGGVNSPARAFRAVGGDPLFIAHGTGSHIFTADGDDLIDYVCSWGPLIHGHAHPAVVAGLEETLRKGTSFGAATELETTLAALIVEMVPSIDLVRMVNSGSEATMSTIRLARGYTGRQKILKFEGCYHGHGDAFLIKAGSGALTLGVPDSPGVTPGTAADTVNARYNDLDSVREALGGREEEFAAIIVEPVAGNMGVVPPAAGFLEGLRDLTRQHGIVLIFDEVITGFRLAPGGAQERFGVLPDLTTLGKVVGGGLPVGAYGGRRAIMEQVAPLGGVYQAGTLSGNPLAMRAGIETLRLLNDPGVYDGLEAKAARLADGITANISGSGRSLQYNRVGSMATLFFSDRPVTDYTTATGSDTAAFSRYFHAMLNAGVYLPPSQFEATFVSTAHTDVDLARTVEANRQALAA